MAALFTARLANRLVRVRQGRRKLDRRAAVNLTALDHLHGAAPAREFDYTIVDVETTGLDRKRSRIVSIGAFKLAAGRIHLGRFFNQLVNPGGDMPPESFAESIAVHGIVPAMVAAAPTGSAALEAFLDYLGSDILVAHNARFDLAFLNRLMRARYGFKLQNLAIDTLPLCDTILLPKLLVPMRRQTKLLGRGAFTPTAKGKPPSLDTYAHHLGIKVHHRHTAAGDALAAAMMLQRGLDKLEGQGRGRLRDLIRLAGI
jgi:DNA polymerase-3 subunit epsilon